MDPMKRESVSQSHMVYICLLGLPFSNWFTLALVPFSLSIPPALGQKAVERCAWFSVHTHICGTCVDSRYLKRELELKSLMIQCEMSIMSFELPTDLVF